MILNIALLITILLELIKAMVVPEFVIYNEQPDQAPVRRYSTAGSIQFPLVKKLMLPSCPLKYKTSVIHSEASKPVVKYAA